MALIAENCWARLSSSDPAEIADCTIFTIIYNLLIFTSCNQHAILYNHPQSLKMHCNLWKSLVNQPKSRAIIQNCGYAITQLKNMDVQSRNHTIKQPFYLRLHDWQSWSLFFRLLVPLVEFLKTGTPWKRHAFSPFLTNLKTNLTTPKTTSRLIIFGEVWPFAGKLANL